MLLLFFCATKVEWCGTARMSKVSEACGELDGDCGLWPVGRACLGAALRAVTVVELFPEAHALLLSRMLQEWAGPWFGEAEGPRSRKQKG